MKLSKHLYMTATAVMGLLFLAGTGCGQDEGDKMEKKMYMQKALDEKNRADMWEKRAHCYANANSAAAEKECAFVGSTGG